MSATVPLLSASRTCLTQPSEGVKNDGADNANSDLIVFAGDVLEGNGGRR